MNSHTSSYSEYSKSGNVTMNVESHVSTFAIRLVAIFALLAATMLGTAQAEVKDEIIFFHVNAVGSATAAFNEAGDLCWKQDYTPYGEQTKNDDASPVDGCGLIGKDRGFTGHTQDESGLTYMQQRYYDASIGRFLSVDPVGVTAGNTNSYNRYMYGNNNPYKYLDPDGRIAILAFVPPLLKAIDVAITAAEVTEAAQNGGAAAAAGVALESAATSVVPGGKLASKVAGAVVGGGKRSRASEAAAEWAARERNGAKPPSLSPDGAGRRGAFREAKRNNNIEYSQRPTVTPNRDKRGVLQPGRNYTFTDRDGKRVNIRDDAGGDSYGRGNSQNRGRHFNDDHGNHYDY